MTNLLRKPLKLNALYGQELTVGASTLAPQSAYMVTEVYDPTTGADAATKDTIATVPLFSNRHLASLADVVWRGNINNSMVQPAYNEVSITTDVAARVVARGQVSYKLRNQSTDIVHVRCYVCRSRQDTNMFNFVSSASFQTSYINLYAQLAAGFAASGIDPAVAGTANNGMNQRQYSPFNSQVFCENWKITRSKTYKLNPGAMKVLGLKSRRIVFRPSKYFAVSGTTTPTTWRGASWVYLHNKFEKFILFQIMSEPMGFGAAQTNYSKEVSNTSPTVILNTQFGYHVNLLPFPKTGTSNIEISGFDAPSSTTNTIVNPLESVLAEEKDAV